jgi:hypothetical protein
MNLNAILYTNGDYGSRWPGQPPVDSAPQPNQTVKNAQLQVADLLFLEQTSVDVPTGPGDTVEFDHVLDVEAGLLHHVSQL